MIICLTGFMGCGKSSVGRRLSELLGWRFMDLDEAIVSKAGKSIPEIFEEEGEAGFRRMEHETLNMVINEYSSSTGGNLVLALGGGTVMTAACAQLVNEHTYCIYLRATVDTLVSRLVSESAGRPMLQPLTDEASGNASDALRARITDLMTLRASTYGSVAHEILNTDGKSIEEISNDITSKHKVEFANNN